ncbi:hypothetical protein [Synechococcus sp. PCC 7336]|uniref:hypothetical protein n=1 Tax=Synechococcus sp. PCC 7336 TaxID=195250 RepID=UPI00034D2D23|nr:hypothetical protein [Synechococcus sp. PCC 7336]
MKVIKARVIDSTHLELSQPISVSEGEDILISIAEREESERLWQDAARERFLAAYDEQDSVYDQL